MIRGLEEVVRDYAQVVNEDALAQITSDIHNVTPHDTGALVESWHSDTVDGFDFFTNHIGFSSEHASYTDEGAPEHDILPRSQGGRLQFFWPDGPDGAGTYTFPSVHHPGIEATHWFTDAIETWPDVVASVVA